MYNFEIRGEIITDIFGRGCPRYEDSTFDVFLRHKFRQKVGCLVMSSSPVGLQRWLVSISTKNVVILRETVLELKRPPYAAQKHNIAQNRIAAATATTVSPSEVIRKSRNP